MLRCLRGKHLICRYHCKWSHFRCCCRCLYKWSHFKWCHCNLWHWGWGWGHFRWCFMHLLNGDTWSDWLWPPHILPISTLFIYTSPFPARPTAAVSAPMPRLWLAPAAGWDCLPRASCCTLTFPRAACCTLTPAAAASAPASWTYPRAAFWFFPRAACWFFPRAACWFFPRAAACWVCPRAAACCTLTPAAAAAAGALIHRPSCCCPS